MTSPEDAEPRPLWQDPRFAPGLAVFGLLALIVAVVLALQGDDPPSDPEAARAAGATVPPVVVSESVTGGSVRPSTLVAVKIDNAPAARPPIGLDSARVTFEVPVEGGVTRFLAFFDPTTPVIVGPVRSVRPVDADLVSVLSSQLVTTGGQPFVVQGLTASGVELIGVGNTPPLFATDAAAPHNQFVELTDFTPAPVPTRIPIGTVPEGPEAPTISVPYTTEINWTFEDGVYVRSEESAPFLVKTDPDSEPVPLTADVVVVMSAARRLAGYQDAAGAEVPTFDVIGGGRLRIFTRGEVIEGSWSRSAQGDPFIFTGDDGTVLGIPDGMSVFIHVLDRTQQPGF